MTTDTTTVHSVQSVSTVVTRQKSNFSSSLYSATDWLIIKLFSSLANLHHLFGQTPRPFTSPQHNIVKKETLIWSYSEIMSTRSGSATFKLALRWLKSLIVDYGTNGQYRIHKLQILSLCFNYHKVKARYWSLAVHWALWDGNSGRRRRSREWDWIGM